MHFSSGILKRIEERLASLSRVRLLFYVFSINLIIVLIFSVISVILFYTITDTNLMANGTVQRTTALLIGGVIFAPLFETLLFQHLPYYLYKKGFLFSKSPIGLLFISAICFGLSHYSSLLFIIATFFCGVVFMLCYMSRASKSKKEAYWLIVIAHALHNLFVIII